MATKIDESILKGMFGAFQQDNLTTEAKFWGINDAGKVPTYPTVFVPGNTTLGINGQERTFANGAFVFQRGEQLDSIPASAVAGGGITVDGSAVSPATMDINFQKSGNIATLRYTDGAQGGPGRLSLTMPQNKGYGFSFRYPAHTETELANMAEKQGAIVQVKDADGKTLEGFFTKGQGGILPSKIDAITTGTDLNPGQFVQVSHRLDGSTYLRPYQNYTAKEMDQYTRFGQYAPPSNNMADLRDMNGQPLKVNKYPAVDVSNGAKVPLAAEGAPKQGPEAQPKAPDAQSPVADGSKLDPSGKPPTPTPDAPASAANEVSAIGKLARFIAPVALAITPAVEGISGGYQAYQKDGSALDTSEGAAIGAGKGLVDTFAPGARDGYSDVFGGGDKTILDRALNAAGDLTGTATAVGSAAIVGEAAGVITIPAIVPTAAATLISGVANLGINAAKGVLKVTGLAGKDQDGGYIYDGATAAIHGIEKLVGSASADSHSDFLLKQSAQPGAKIDGAAVDTPEGRPGLQHNYR